MRVCLKRLSPYYFLLAATTTPHTFAADSGPILEMVTVTAQKRSENLQATPISIAAISGESLERIPLSNTGDLAKYVPGLLVGKSAFVGQTYLRGVGQSNGVPGVESPIATYLDGIYLGAPALSVFDLNNISQIAVLRGPQGTLFGRNATGGVIQITTREADHDFGVSAEVGYSSFNTTTGRLYVTGGVTPDLATSLAFSGKDRQEGVLRNVTTGSKLQDEKSYTVQNKWLWDAGENTTVKLNLLHGEYDNLPGAVYSVYPNTLASDGATTYLGEHNVANRNDGSNTTESSIASATVLHDFDWGRISSQTSYATFNGDLVLNQSAHPGRPNVNNAAAQISGLYGKIDSWTEELQIQAPASAHFQWIVGAFYLRDHTAVELNVHLDDTPFAFVDTDVRTDSYSVFGQATHPLGELAQVTAGVRYTRDTKDFSGITGAGLRPAPTLPTEKSWSQMTWRLALNYQFTTEVMGYVSHDRGFKSGTYTNTAVIFPPAAPETVNAYEVGLKSQLMGRRVRINGAAFLYDYEDLQLRTVAGSTILTYNAANSRIYGVDLDVDALLTDKLTLSAAAEVLRARYTHFPSGPVGVPTPLLTIPAGCTGAVNPRVGGAATIACDLKGNHMVKAPPLSATLSLQYDTQIAGFETIFSLQDRYSASYYFEPDNVLKQNAYHMVDATASVSPMRGAWRLTLWGTDLTAARVFDTGVTAGNTFAYAPGSPRLYGATLNVTY